MDMNRFELSDGKALTFGEVLRTIDNMDRHGGGFVSALSLAASRGDMRNLKTLISAFPDIFDKYSDPRWNR
jgi:hypothetical protein